MRLLLDTNVFLWWQWHDRRLPTVIRETIEAWESEVTAIHAELAGDPPRHHGDPFDRMLIAQARLEGLVIATQDRHFSLYGVPVLGAG